MVTFFITFYFFSLFLLFVVQNVLYLDVCVEGRVKGYIGLLSTWVVFCFLLSCCLFFLFIVISLCYHCNGIVCCFVWLFLDSMPVNRGEVTMVS